PEVRKALIRLAGDPAASVRGSVVAAVESMQITDDEAVELEDLLRRKAGDLRRAVVGLLVARGPEKALISADRLLASRDGQQHLAGLEILRRLVEKGRLVGAVRERARVYRDAAGDSRLGDAERTQLAAILGEAVPSPAHREPGEHADADVDAGAGAGDETLAASAPSATAPARVDASLPAVPTTVDGFGLLDPAGRTVPGRLRFHDVAFSSDAATRILVELDALVHENRDAVVEVETWTGTEQKPLGELTREFPAAPGGPRPRIASSPPVPRDLATIASDLERGRERLPLHDVWTGWAAARGAGLRDPDGLALLRAHFVPVAPPSGGRPGPLDAWTQAVDAILGGGREPVRLRYPHVVASVVSWLCVLEPPRGMAAFLLDAAEDLLMKIPSGTPIDGDRSDWRNFRPGWRDDGSPWLTTLRTARTLRRCRPDLWTTEDHARLWSLERWVDEGGRADLGPAGEAAAVWGATAPRPAERGFVGGIVDKLRKSKVVIAAVGRPVRKAPPLDELVAAFRTGVATPDDVIDALVGPGSGASGPWAHFRHLSILSARTMPMFAAGDDRLAEVVERIRGRIVAVELRRGEAPTEASRAALALQYSGGLDKLVHLVRALGSESFVRGWSYDGESRQVVFSRLIRATMPGPTDTPAAFVAGMRAARIPERRLVELGCFAPQWADHVETAVGWPGLASATWWMHAHTKDPSWVVGNEVREAWKSTIAERTPLDSADLLEGAVDVTWFADVLAQLGPERWKVLDAASKYGSTGGGHTRAQLFANAMRGATGEASIVARMTDKRHQDSARALGLVPLPSGDGSERDEAVLDRYRTLQEFIRTSRQFGSARQASEKRAAEIGLQNLARTAGYADPIRLGWAMEARGVADLADGPLVASAGDVEATLAIDDHGAPELVIRRDGTVLKAVPAEAKKSKEISALRSRATDLRRQAARMRRSLEAAMVRGDG
ncbi:MAG TPA: DUF5724 domain-containing protein, partial [Candidatus Limnocylindrales bacterium]|nr:DUF5724 domain-containing protein [Candidatus Limnocylindrales bacterium]